MSSQASIIWLTLGGRETASSRVRAFALSDALERAGFRSKCIVAIGIRGRLRALAQIIASGRNSVVVVQKVLYGRVMLSVLRRSARVLVWECDDALHVADSGASDEQARRVRRRIAETLRVAEVVTTSNPLLAADFCPRSGRVVVFQGPAPLVTEGHVSKPGRERVVVWLGSPSTEPYLESLRGLPARLRTGGWHAVAVGGSSRAADLGWAAIPWSFEAQETWLERAVVGLMPQPTDPWADRKQGYKLMEYMAHGVVPVASDVLPARILMESSDLAPFLVPEDGDWLPVIERAARARPDLLPSLYAITQRLSPESVLRDWTRAVGVGELE